jgi:anaerobic selenocysteine-containing dehydrogenase
MQLMRPVVPAQGECRSDLQILQALAERLGFGPDMAGSPARWIDQVAAPFPGISYETLGAAGGRLIPEDTTRVPWASGEFKTPSGRFAFPDRFDDDPVIAPEGYLHLVFLATERAINSQINAEPGLASVRVHPRAAAARGFADGDEVALVSSRGGRLHVRLTLDTSTREDTVVALKGEWLKRGRGFNVLTEPRYTAGTGTAYNQNYVRLAPAREA